MNISVDDKSIEKFEKMLSRKSKPYAVKVRVLKVGWAGPILGTALEEQKEGQEYINVKGVNFTFDESVALYNSDVKIYTGKKLYGDGEGMVVELA